ncbi:S-layer homology domain-containing protein [Peptoniphilus indolicus]|uniref:S-layer homology domain n=1 Tax=Peptoniphilus indolicus TaxID=33030 RepID=A0A379DDJ5_9FIRM|nr:S-layer homology domain-containing protein [Peptoniphilus indolicus]SUB76024.1 S-layer homology domain [Peptoniphilus indolicus]
MKKIKFTAIVLGAVTLFSSSVYAKSFRDVKQNGQFKWIYSELNTLSDRGIFGGYPEGDFRPNNPVSFLEIIQVIKNIKQPSISELEEARANYLETIKKYNIPHWAYDSVAYALNNNTITEKTIEVAEKRGFFRDKNPTYPNRNSVTVYFGRAFGFSGIGNTQILKHSDLQNVPQVTLGYLSELVKNGIFSETGSEGKFNGSNYIRRAEVVSIAAKSLKFLEKNNIKTDNLIDYTLINKKEETDNVNSSTLEEVSGVIESVDVSKNIIKISSKDYIVFSSTNVSGVEGYNFENINKLNGARVTLKHINGVVKEIKVHSHLETEKYNAKFVGRVTGKTIENDTNKLSVNILVSNNTEIVSGSNVEIKTVNNFSIGDIITFDARIENGYIVEVNIKR